MCYNIVEKIKYFVILASLKNEGRSLLQNILIHFFFSCSITLISVNIISRYFVVNKLEMFSIFGFVLLLEVSGYSDYIVKCIKI